MIGVLESRIVGPMKNWKDLPLVMEKSGKVTFKKGTVKYLAVGGGGFGGYYGAGGAGSGFVEAGELTFKEKETVDVVVGAGGLSLDGGDTTIGKTVVAKGGKSPATGMDGGAGWSGGGASACCDGDPKRAGGMGGWNGGDGGDGKDGRDPGVGGKGQKINLPLDLDFIHPGKGGTSNSTADQPVKFYGGGGGGVVVAGHPVGSPKRLHGGQGFGAGGGCCSDFNYVIGYKKTVDVMLEALTQC